MGAWAQKASQEKSNWRKSRGLKIVLVLWESPSGLSYGDSEDHCPSNLHLCLYCMFAGGPITARSAATGRTLSNLCTWLLWLHYTIFVEPLFFLPRTGSLCSGDYPWFILQWELCLHCTWIQQFPAVLRPRQNYVVQLDLPGLYF